MLQQTKNLIKSVLPHSVLNSREFIVVNQAIQIKLPKFIFLQVDRIYSHLFPSSFLEKERRKYDQEFYNQSSKKLVGAQEKRISIHILEYLLANYDVKSILDVGCGFGQVVRQCLELGYQVKGIDISKWVIETYLKDLHEQDTVFQSPSSSLPFSDNIFDLVVSFNLLEHIATSEVKKTLREIWRVSKKHTFHCISTKRSAPLNRREMHLTAKNRDWWINQFRLAGFSIQRDDLVDQILTQAYVRTSNEHLKKSIEEKRHHYLAWEK